MARVNREGKMMQFYSDPSRGNDPHALPDCEVFYVGPGGWSPSEIAGDYESGDTRELDPGWYYQFCFPGCLPDSELIGPFDTEREAIESAQSEAI